MKLKFKATKQDWLIFVLFIDIDNIGINLLSSSPFVIILALRLVGVGQ